jgi:hypothetical protein
MCYFAICDNKSFLRYAKEQNVFATLINKIVASLTPFRQVPISRMVKKWGVSVWGIKARFGADA